MNDLEYVKERILILGIKRDEKISEKSLWEGDGCLEPDEEYAECLQNIIGKIDSEIDILKSILNKISK